MLYLDMYHINTSVGWVLRGGRYSVVSILIYKVFFSPIECVSNGDLFFMIYNVLTVLRIIDSLEGPPCFLLIGAILCGRS